MILRYILKWFLAENNDSIIEAILCAFFGASLATGLAGLVYIIPIMQAMHPILLGAIVLASVEAFFWLDKSQPKNGESRYRFATKRKFEAILDVVFIAGQLGAAKWCGDNFGSFLEWLGVNASLLLGLMVCVATLAAFVCINAQRYKEAAKQ